MFNQETLTQPSSSPPVISVIIPVRDGGARFRRCLQALTQADSSPKEIIVVADGDTDGSSCVAEEFGAKVIRIPQSQGPARARNIGAHEAQGDILFFIDSDVLVSPDALRQVEAAFRNDLQLTALFGSYDDKPGETNFLSQYKNLFHHYVHQISHEEASTFWAGCGAIRRQIFKEMGGFDESFKKPSIEDIELGYRLKHAGHHILLSKRLQVKHLKRWDTKNLLITDFFDRALPWTHLILRSQSFINDLNLRLSSRLSVILTYCFLAALIGGIGWRSSLVLAGGFALLLILINLSLYKFFLHQRGFWFMIRSIPWHWFYYFYSGLAFAIGYGRFLFSPPLPPKVCSPAISKSPPDTVPLSENR